jgi:hypothetical protein
MNSLTAMDTVAARSREARRHVQIMFWPGYPSSVLVDTMSFPAVFAAGDAKSLNDKFIAILDDLRKDVQRNGIDLTNYQHQYFERLRDTGKAAYNYILPADCRSRMRQIEAETGDRGLGITFMTPGDLSFAWEMLCDADIRTADPSSFWGFRYSLGRTHWNIRYTDRIRLQMGAFSVIHRQLVDSRLEADNLKLLIDELSRRTSQQLTFLLLDNVVAPKQTTIQDLVEMLHSDEFRYGIVHFACHCDKPPEDQGTLEACLTFTVEEQEMGLTLENLLTWQDCGFVHQPLVFLNACHSATPGRLLETLSFPNGFSGFGAGCVVATACTIPDNFASAFAKKFYSLLLKESSTGYVIDIAEALLSTRLYFLHEFNNPLGLAYRLYALSNVQLQLAV